MFDYHTHSLLSDGDLLPAELIRRAQHIGYRALGITDHVDSGNLTEVIASLSRTCFDIGRASEMVVLPGVEVTHVPPAQIAGLAGRARELGAALVIAHGETVVEPVMPGTNRAALSSEIDVLAHPGLIAVEDVQLAADRGIYLELSARRGHCLTNGHLVRMAKESDALHLLVIASDAHAPDDLLSAERRRAVGLGAGLTPTELEQIVENAGRLLEKVNHGTS